MVTNEAQAESVLYGDLGAVSALPSGASVIISSTISPAYVSLLERHLQNEPKDLKLVNAPVSGGVKRASMGTFTIIASGTDEALKHFGSVLLALSEKLYVIKGGCADCVTIVSGKPQVQIGTHLFTFDHVYGCTGSPSSSMFKECVAPLVDGLFQGYNATVLAYGQTGSGSINM
ncbi:hypothetical protein CsSME_00020816 [Camellia sinensis var. sinensis]